MTAEQTVKNGVVRVVTGDITDLEVEAFVFYATNDLKLGSGYGNAIAVRGGPGVQKELDELGGIGDGEAIVSGAGDMKAEKIVHVVGPRFREDDIERKLRDAIVAALRAADEAGIRQIALPPMGAGFYGVPLADSTRITVDSVCSYLAGETGLREIVLCGRDGRETRPLAAQLKETRGRPGREEGR